MKRLISSGLIRVRREGQFVRYLVNGDRDEILKLVQGYHPSTWASWVDRFANALNEVSPPPSREDKSRDSKQGIEPV